MGQGMSNHPDNELNPDMEDDLLPIFYPIPRPRFIAFKNTDKWKITSLKQKT